MTKGLRDLIIKSAPTNTICKLDHKKPSFTKVPPLYLLIHLQGRAEVVDYEKINKLLNKRNKEYNSKGDIMLQTHLENVKQTVKELVEHNVNISKSEYLAHLLRHVEEQGDTQLNKGLDWWTGLSSNEQTWAKFSEIMGNTDKK